MSLLGRENPK